MNQTICDQVTETIAVTRNSKYLSGESVMPFSVTVVFGDFKREYEKSSFEMAADLAERLSLTYHINYTVERGIDPEIDEWVDYMESI